MENQRLRLQNAQSQRKDQEAECMKKKHLYLKDRMMEEFTKDTGISTTKR